MNSEDILISWDDVEPKPLDDLIFLLEGTKEVLEQATAFIPDAAAPGPVISFLEPENEKLVRSVKTGRFQKSVVKRKLDSDLPAAHEDFNSYLARTGGVDHERLSRLVGSFSPRIDEDFVSYLARTNEIKDEETIRKLRQALKCDSPEQFPITLRFPVKLEAGNLESDELVVGENEDAVSFFVRMGSWDVSSSVSEEMASVGLDEYEDAESFLRRTGTLSNDNIFEFDLGNATRDLSLPVKLRSPKQELKSLTSQVLIPVHEVSESLPMMESRSRLKRKSAEVEE